MKNFINMLFATAAIFALVACNGDDNVGRTFSYQPVGIESANLSFTDSPNKGQVVVKPGYVITNVASSNDWCKAEFNGNTVTVEVLQNTALTARVADLTINTQNGNITLPVQQQGLPTFTVDGGEERELDYNDTTLTLNYKHIEGIKVATYVLTGGNWIQASANNGVITLSVKANNTPLERTGTIRVVSGETRASRELVITLKQDWDVNTQVMGQWQLSYFEKYDTTGISRKTLDCAFTADSIHIDFGNDGKLAFKYTKKMGKPYALIIKGSQRCGGKINNATPYLYLAADSTKTWTGKNENTTTLTANFVRNQNNKLSATPRGFIIDDPRQRFTSFGIVTFDNAPATGFPTTDEGRKKYVDLYFPVFIKK